jgi:hypothetical protein
VAKGNDESITPWASCVKGMAFDLEDIRGTVTDEDIIIILTMCEGTSVHFLTSPLLSYSPLVHMYFPHTFVPSPGTTHKANNFPDVDSLKVVDFPPLPLLVPQWHQMCLGHIRTGPHDTMAPSTVTWIAIHGRLGTGRLGTVILSISFVA